ARTLFGREREQILAAIGDRALRDLVALAAGQDLHERALTRAVRAHDRVDFARADFQGQAVQDLTIAGTYVKIRNRKHDVVSPSFEACHRQPESLWLSPVACYHAQASSHRTLETHRQQVLR